MSQNGNEENFAFLADFTRAMQYAQEQEQKTRHGSTAAELERARQLGEVLVASFNDPEVAEGRSHPAGRTQLMALRDLPENEGIVLVVQYRGKQHGLKVDFEELKATSGRPTIQSTLIARWRKELPLAASLIREPQVISGTAKPVTKKLPTGARTEVLKSTPRKRAAKS